MQPRVSIIIPTFKHRDWILATLCSVFSQTFTDFEVIVINDGSPDDTNLVLLPLIQDGKIRYYEQTNTGQSSARNRGLAQARGEFIAFLDDDDLWPADKLTWQVSVLDADPSIAAVAGTALFIDGKDQPAGKSEFWDSISFESLFKANPIMSPGQVLVRRSVLTEVGGLDTSIWGADDWDLWFKIAYRHRFLMRDRTALLYRLHDSNATRQMRRLYLGSHTVLERHLSRIPWPESRQFRRAAYKLLYNGWGSKLAVSAKGNVLGLHFLEAIKDMSAIASLWRGVSTNPWLLYRVPADITSLRLRLLVRKFCGKATS